MTSTNPTPMSKLGTYKVETQKTKLARNCVLWANSAIALWFQDGLGPFKDRWLGEGDWPGYRSGARGYSLPESFRYTQWAIPKKGQGILIKINCYIL